MLWLFWLSLLFLVYTLLGYPLLLWLLSVVRSQTHRRSPICPSIALIIPAHNEASGLANKIRNSLALTYPKELREILVVSDGSQDATADVVRSFADQDVKLVELEERRGKHYAQMIARDRSIGEILVFTDASVNLDRSVLEQVVSNFADPSVGCVSSEDQVSRTGEKGEGRYVKFEMWLRRLESQVGSLVSASGSFFAARRELCDVWHPDQSSDFFIPLHAAERKLRTVVDPECRGHYGVAQEEKIEFDRKVRTVVHGLNVVATHLHLLNPLRHAFFAWQLVSHKVLRWLAPMAGLLLLLANLFLWNTGTFYRVTLALQAALYLAGLAALAVAGLRKIRAFELAGFFVMVNAATLVAWIKYLRGERFVSWQPTRRS